MYPLTKPQQTFYSGEEIAGDSISVICGSMLIPTSKSVIEMSGAIQEIYRINDFLFFYRMKNANESRNSFAENYHDELRAVLCEKYPQLRKDHLVNITFSILRFFFQKKITCSNKLIIKICKIPVFRKKLNNAITLMY